MKIIGVSAFYHDSAAALLIDGEIIAAAQEERFTRIKGDSSFPRNSVEYCLTEAGLKIGDIDHLVFYDKPILKFERLLETYLAIAPSGYRSIVRGMPIWLKTKLWLERIITKETGFEKSVLFAEHHESHSASAFYPSPFESAAILTVDGVGEWATTCIGRGVGSEIELTHQINFPHSLGLLYSAFTYYLGFKVNSGEYKLMGLAPYGKSRYAQKIFDNLIDLKPDGSFRLNMEYFDYLGGLTMTNKRFDKLFDGAPHRPETELTQREMDLASSIQQVIEEALLRLAKTARKETGEKNLCLAGGVALNCVANGKILKSGLFENIWIQPASGDAGGALGAALAIWHRYLGKERKFGQRDKKDSMRGSLLGPSFNDEKIVATLKAKGIEFERLDASELTRKVAAHIAGGAVVGWFQGRMEYGPRALGARSILGDPRNSAMQSRMNLKIKYRESFRPFAPVVKEDAVADWFDTDRPSPYMLLVADVAESKLSKEPNDSAAVGFDLLKSIRSEIPAVTHVDNSARLQTTTRATNELYYDLLSEFGKLTGCPVLINTSFNVRGEPIVCTPEDALECFLNTEIDFLAIGSFLCAKTESQRGAARKPTERGLPLD
ncbi:MAG: carbamoyltransferase [candidate division Zixibacteria bacterium]|nr:carbamoyltransferase [candidate division Zixibacteria bacterium]